MQRIPLKADERQVLGKKVKKLREDGLVPAHVFGNKVETEHVSLKVRDFLPVLGQAGETGLIDLKIGEEKVRPVMIKGTQYDPRNGKLLHVDFYQVNLSEKVEVPVPIELTGEEAEAVHLGEAVILQTLNEVQVEALPADLIEKIEVDITSLQKVGDHITVSQINVDREKITVLAEPDDVVVKMDKAITEEMKRLMEEQAVEAAAAEAESAEGEEAVEVGVEEAVEGKDESAEAGGGPAFDKSSADKEESEQDDTQEKPKG